MVPSNEGMRLRPMTIGDVIDETIKIYRRHFLAFVMAMAVSAVLQAVFTIGISVGSAGLTQGRVPPAEQIAAVAAIAVPGGLLVGFAYLLSNRLMCSSV